ncbi:MAG: PEGA domain-containing protein [Myxococcales bacterium]
MRFLSLAAALLLSLPALASTLKVTTDPEGALVQLDGAAKGHAPVTIADVPPGVHELKVSKDGYVTRVDSLQVGVDQELIVHAPLNPAPKPVQPAPPPPVQPMPQTHYVPQPPPVVAPAPPQPMPQTRYVPSPPPVLAPPPPPPAAPAAPPPPMPVSELPVAWGTQKKSLVLTVTTTPADAMVQVVGLPDIKRSPAIFPGFAPGTVRVRVFAAGHQEQTVPIELQGDVRTHVTLQPLR